MRDNKTKFEQEKPLYVFSLDSREGWKLTLPHTNGILLNSNCPLLLVPQLADGLEFPTEVQCSATPDGLLLTADLSSGCQLRNELFLMHDRLVVNAEVYCNRPTAVHHWHVMAPGAEFAAESIHAYIGGPEHYGNGCVVDAADCNLTTASHNWLYGPLVPHYILKKGAFSVGFGGTRLSHDFGLELCVQKHKVRHFRFNFGGGDGPFPVAAGGICRAPRLQMHVTTNLSNDQAHGAFTQKMIDDGLLPVRHDPPEAARWRRPWYCTWGDQMNIVRRGPHLQDMAQTPELPDIKEILTADFILKAARLIREQDLNIGTLIIDEGWQDFRGDWNLAEERIPDMRGLVEQLHQMNFNVVLWWAPLVVEDAAAVAQRPELLATPTPYGAQVFDYTNPEARAFMAEKLDRWFSAAKDGWNIDGLKLDFLVERVYPQCKVIDYDWYGEERLIANLVRFAYDIARRHKECPGILGEQYSPHVVDCCIHFQFEERMGKDISWMALRPAMAEALIPGASLSPHFNYHPEVVPEYIRATRAFGGIPQIATLLSPGVTPEWLREIRDLLAD